ncbi:MAG: hypothetical protein EOP47_18965, partial [Sphingobacteriaceae bacterium]
MLFIKTFFLGLIVAGLSLASCKKSKPSPEKPEVIIPGDTLTYCSGDPHLYWTMPVIQQSNKDVGIPDIAADAHGNFYTASMMGNYTVDADPGSKEVLFDGMGILVQKFATDKTLIWVKQLKIPAEVPFYGWPDGIKITLDASQNIYVNYIVKDTLKTSTAAANMVVVKLNNAGNVVYTKTLETNRDYAIWPKIAVDALGNVYWYHHNNMLQKLNAAGNVVFDQVFVTGSLGGKIVDVKTGTSGAVYIVGSFIGKETDFDPGEGVYHLKLSGGMPIPDNDANGYIIYLQKLDVNSNFIWVKDISSYHTSNSSANLFTDKWENLYVTNLSEPWAVSHSLKYNKEGVFLVNEYNEQTSSAEYNNNTTLAEDRVGNVYVIDGGKLKKRNSSLNITWTNPLKIRDDRLAFKNEKNIYTVALLIDSNFRQRWVIRNYSL